MNKQKPSPVQSGQNPKGILQVHSIFKTIQGEGPFAGHPSIFIRLKGCNLQCPLCDTDYTSGKDDSISPEDLVWRVERMANYTRAPDLVVITGGEPFRQNIAPLVELLLLHKFRVQIETNGTLYLSLPFLDRGLTIVCSPKTGQVNKYLLPHISAFKYVVQDGDIAEDGLPRSALQHPNPSLLFRPPKKAKVYIQPADEQDEEKNSKNLAAAIASSKQTGYILCLQLHKLIGEQ